jgi:hypothetical protein
MLKIMFVMLSLSVSTPGKSKSLLDRGGNRTLDLWFASLWSISKNAISSQLSFCSQNSPKVTFN